ncbi:MAG: amidohydrolase family protein [Acidimicrobiia bacterium]
MPFTPDMKIISADTHLEVSPDRWRSYVDREFREFVPNVIRLDNGGDAWVLPNSPAPVPLGTNFAAGIPRHRWNGPVAYDENPPGSGDGAQRVAELDRDGIWAEIEYPAVQGQRAFHSLVPRDAYIAIVRGYNDWLSQEHTAADPDRLLGVALLPATGLEETIEEYVRVSSMPGICSVILHHWPSGGAAPSDDDDRFWAAVQDVGFPVSVHVGLGARTSGATVAKGHFNHQTAVGTFGASNYTQWSIVQFILTGVFDRFPAMTMFFAESGISWVPAYLERIDNGYERHRDWTGFSLARMPSEYIRERCLFGFQDDAYGVKHRDEIGVDKIMWANDFPHSAGDWPDSLAVIERLFADVPDDEVRLVLHDNAARYFKLPA